MGRRSLRPTRTPKKGNYVSPYAMETPVAMSSPTESLTSTESGERSSLPSAGEIANHSDIIVKNNFIRDLEVESGMKGEEHIVVDAPALNIGNSTMPGVEMEDDLDDDEDVDVTPQHKRKRVSVNYNLDDQELYYGKPLHHAATAEPKAKRRNGPKVRGIIIGVWRDSSEPDNAEKHVVFGFIDIHDRLRTRIYSMNRRGEELIGNAPTGAGGCWVTFERVIFEPHLESLTSVQIKEYVKLRAEVKLEDNLDDRKAAEIAAVIQAKKNATAIVTNPPETRIPTHYRRSTGRTSMGRESIDASTLRTSGFQAVNSPHAPTPKAPAESKATGVPLGYWADSDEPDPVNKHAVFGVISESDCFRVKVQRVTRDGRSVIGNFPTGAGAMWIKFDQMVVEPHLASLTRPELKEFCRIRQRHLATGEVENPKNRQNNEKQAIRDAKSVIAAQNGGGFVEVGTASSFSASGRASPEPEVRHSARSELKQAAKQQAEAEAIATRARQEKAKAQMERNEMTRKEVAIAEAHVKDRVANELKQNINYLNKVWVAQQNATMNGVSPANSTFGGTSAGFVHQQSPVATPAAPVEQEVKFHNGIRYERKTMGPFAGKLVGGPQIFNIDGEDYVEYRILTKPSFA